MFRGITVKKDNNNTNNIITLILNIIIAVLNVVVTAMSNNVQEVAMLVYQHFIC